CARGQQLCRPVVGIDVLLLRERRGHLLLRRHVRLLQALVRGQAMTGRHQDRTTPLTIVTGVAGVLLGIMVGYMLGVSQPGGGSTPVAAASQSAAAPAEGANEQELQAYRNVLASNPKNVRANTELANRLYDAGRYAEAVPYYQQAFALDP